MKREFVICEHCKTITIVKLLKYKSHLFVVHKLILADDVDLTSKIATANEVRQQKEELNNSRQKQQEERLKRAREIEAQKQFDLARQKQRHIDENTAYHPVIWEDILTRA